MKEYNYDILQIFTSPNIDGLPDVVRKVHWYYKVTEGTNSGEKYYMTELSSPDPTKFIAYNTLQRETIWDWITATVDINQVNIEVVEQMAIRADPTTIIQNELPWIPVYPYQPEKDLYVMVYKGKIYYGPAHWHSDILNHELEQLGYPKSLPETILARRQSLVPYDKPLIFDDDLQIYAAKFANEKHPDDQIWENDIKTWDLSTGIAICTFTAKMRSFEYIRDIAIATLFQIRGARDNKVLTWQYNDNGNSIQLDTRWITIENINVVKNNFKTASGKYFLRNYIGFVVQLTETELENIHSQLVTKFQEKDQWEIEWHNKIFATTNQEEISEVLIELNSMLNLIMESDEFTDIE